MMAVDVAVQTKSDKISFFSKLVEKVCMLSIEERASRMEEVLITFKRAINVAARAPEMKKIA